MLFFLFIDLISVLKIHTDFIKLFSRHLEKIEQNSKATTNWFSPNCELLSSPSFIWKNSAESEQCCVSAYNDHTDHYKCYTCFLFFCFDFYPYIGCKKNVPDKIFLMSDDVLICMHHFFLPQKIV